MRTPPSFGEALVGTLVAWTSGHQRQPHYGPPDVPTPPQSRAGRWHRLSHAVVACTYPPPGQCCLDHGRTPHSRRYLGVVIGSRLTVKLPKPMLRARFTLVISGTSLILGDTMAHVIHHELNALPYERTQWAESATTLELDWIWETFGKNAAFGTAFGKEGCALIDLTCATDLSLTSSPSIPGISFQTLKLWRDIETRYGIVIRAVRPAMDISKQDTKYGAKLYECIQRAAATQVQTTRRCPKR